MGYNEVNLVEGYLKLLKESEIAKESGDLYEAAIINAKIEGIIFAHEAYTTQTFNQILERWEWYNRER